LQKAGPTFEFLPSTEFLAGGVKVTPDPTQSSPVETLVGLEKISTYFFKKMQKKVGLLGSFLQKLKFSVRSHDVRHINETKFPGCKPNYT
jgi:hypothetical protein